jgi:hypothetical protein
VDYSIEDLILKGAIEVAGLDEFSGEFLYNFTPRAKEIMPELFRDHMEKVYRYIMFFWEKGFVEIRNITELRPIVYLTEKAFDEDALDELPVDARQALEEIRRGFEG